MNFFKRFFLLAIFSGLFIACKTDEDLLSLEAKYPVIPIPNELNYGEKEINFTSFTIENSEFEEEVLKLKNFFESKGLIVSNGGLKVQLKKLDSIDKNNEGYLLTIDNGITISSSTNRGAFYGIQTVKQLFRIKDGKGILPQVAIRDYPAFKIRGFMHDTGRNFQYVEQLKEQIDILSQYKYNIFHWHLTDNPGWRLESKLYPELQSEEATSRHKGKYYTQEDFKEIVEFCKERHITVIPELDIPGHTEAFRKALGINSMKEDRVLPILKGLFDELMSLVPADDMPYVHIGTDEVRNEEEYVSSEFILELMNHIKSTGKELIVWKEGIVIPEDSTSINQLWAYHEGRKGHRFIDSRSNYINHLDPFAGMARLYFQQPCRQPKGDSLALGGILCAWPDNNVNIGRDILKQNPIYPAMVFYSDAIWNGRGKDYPEYWAKLPQKESPEFQAFKNFEKKVIIHRNEFFKRKEFPYVEQTNIGWNIIGPFNHQGDFNKEFEIEDEIKETYNIDNKNFSWTGPYYGGTIHLKHFFGFPSITTVKEGTYYAHSNIYSPDDRTQDFWIGFQGWSRSNRRGGPTPSVGEWHYTMPKIWVNENEIEPPHWKQPGLIDKDSEISFIDEDYFYRDPLKISLKKGWNKVLLKIPQGGKSWKWMFTCVPINISKEGIREVEDLMFSIDYNAK